MLKLHLSSNSFHKKCGEVFYTSTTHFSVVCDVCSSNIRLEEFALHFRIHLNVTLDEETISIEELNRKRRLKLARDASLHDNMAIKQEDPMDDPIESIEIAPVLEELKDEMALEPEQPTILDTITENQNYGNIASSEEEEYDFDENKSLLQLIREKSAKSKSKNIAIDIPINESETYHELADINQSKENVSEEIHNDDIDRTMDNMFSTDDEEQDGKTSAFVNQTFKCNICNLAYFHKRSLQKHIHNVHNPKNTKEPKEEHKCPQCEITCKSERELKGHMWTHTGIVCDICGMKFTQTGNLMLHKIRHTGIKAHKCQECSKDFFTAKELKAHLIRHTGVYPVICEICGKRCRDRGVLTAHMRRHTGERPAKCNVCNKSFFSIYDLNVHAVTHTNERPFKCDICGSTFQRKKSLRVHKLIHNKDRKHVCKICGKAFAQSGGLNSHVNKAHNAAVDVDIVEF